MKNLAYISGIVAAALAICSCTKEAGEEPYFRAVPQNGDSTFEMPCSKTSLTDRTGLKVFVYSNLSWSVRAKVEEGADDSWFSIYPESGDRDGRFYINVTELDNPYPRSFRLVFEGADGSELYSTAFTQTGTEPYIIPDHGMLSYGSAGGTLKIAVSSNVKWRAEFIPVQEGDDISWCSVGGISDGAVEVTASPNQTDDKRSALLRISMTGREEVHADIPVSQLPVYSVRNARPVTVAEALNLSGVVEDNIKVEGYVTSDISTGNFDNGTDLFIQDDSGAGMIIRLPSAADNVYPVGTALTFWLTGAVAQTGADGMFRMTNITTDNIYTESTLTGNGAEPVTVSDLSELGNHLYSLVTVKDVHFACPVGTLCNVGTWKDGHSEYALSPVIDASGNKAFIRTRASFTQKYDRNLTGNSYDITGIVLPDKGELLHIGGDRNNVKVMDGFDFRCSLRLRYSSDMADSGTPGSFSPIAYWLGPNTANTSFWTPAYGNGSFDLIAGISGAKKPNSSARVSYALMDASGAHADDNCWKGYSTTTPWDATYGGYYYELSTSTAGCSGKIVMSFLVGSFGSAARYYKLQYDLGDGVWKDVPGGALEMWNSMTSGTSSASDYSRLYAAQPFSAVLPQDASGKDVLKVRLTTKGCENTRCDGSGKAAASSSSFCLYYFAFSELK